MTFPEKFYSYQNTKKEGQIDFSGLKKGKFRILDNNVRDLNGMDL